MTETLEQTVGIPRRLLTFRIDEEWYGVEVSRVRRVLPRPEWTPVPGAPPAIPGVFASQGQLVAAVDPRAILNLAPPGEGAGAFVVITADADGGAGLVVDWVDQVVTVDEGAIEPPNPAMGAGFSTGQVRLRDSLVSLLDLPALFAAAGG